MTWWGFACHMLSCCMRLAGWRRWRVVVSCALQMCIYDGSTLMHSIHPCRVSLRIFPLNQGYRVDEVSVQNRLNPDGEGGRVSWLRPGYSVDETVQHPALTWTTAGTYLSQLDERQRRMDFGAGVRRLPTIGPGHLHSMSSTW
jgi:hypothetical protein